MRLAVLLSSLLLLSACDSSEHEAVYGYMEADYVYVAPTVSGLLDRITVQRGDAVQVGDALFAVNSTNLAADAAAAEAGLASAQANLANLSKGKRPEEILVILRQREQAEADRVNAEKDYHRYLALGKTDVASKASLDLKTAAYEVAKGRVEELDAQVATAMLAARPDELTMAEQGIRTARETLRKAQQQQADSAPVAKASARVEDVYYRLGELVPMGTPVLKLLPPDNIKVRFFVSQKTLPQLHIGDTVRIVCDGCAQEHPARISFIAAQAEFTPPVIYSVESRQKLVFMVEARPLHYSPDLHIGLPVSIRMGS